MPPVSSTSSHFRQNFGPADWYPASTLATVEREKDVAPRRELAEHLEAIVGRLTAVTALAERLHAQAQEQTETTDT